MRVLNGHYPRLLQRTMHPWMTNPARSAAYLIRHLTRLELSRLSYSTGPSRIFHRDSSFSIARFHRLILYVLSHHEESLDLLYPGSSCKSGPPNVLSFLTPSQSTLPRRLDSSMVQLDSVYYLLHLVFLSSRSSSSFRKHVKIWLAGLLRHIIVRANALRIPCTLRDRQPRVRFSWPYSAERDSGWVRIFRSSTYVPSFC